MAARAAVLRDTETDLRSHLVVAACQLLEPGVVGPPTVRDIAQRAQVAVGVLYNHFDDRDELLALALRQRVRDADAALGPPPGPAGTGSLHANLAAFVVRSLDLHAAVLPALVALATRPSVLHTFALLEHADGEPTTVRDHLVSYLRAEQALGRLHPDADVAMAATVVSGACHELVLPEIFAGAGAHARGGAASHGPEVPAGFVEALVSLVLDGVG